MAESRLRVDAHLLKVALWRRRGTVALAVLAVAIGTSVASALLHVSGDIGRKVAHLTQRAWTCYWARRAANATVAILHGLDDRALKDIGLDRSEIESVVYGDGSPCRGSAPSTRRLFPERRVDMHL